MFSFSQQSLDNLAECDPQLQELMNEVIKYFDCAIICGHRGQVEQHKAFIEGNSEVDWPNGKHNSIPSKALDALPYYSDRISRESAQNHYFFAGFVKAIAIKMGIKVRIGADWNGDKNTLNQSLKDPCHIEVE